MARPAPPGSTVVRWVPCEGCSARWSPSPSDPAVTHVAVAFDAVVDPPNAGRDRSNEGLIAAQQALAAETVRALGLALWPSGRYQADELLASGAHQLALDPAVDQVVICSIDNDFTQCVRGTRVVLLDRIREIVTDEDRVRERSASLRLRSPTSSPCVGDRSDGLPGLPGWGWRSAAEVLRRYGSVDAIPLDAAEWDVARAGPRALGRGAARAVGRGRCCAATWRSSGSTCRCGPRRPLLEWRGAHRERIDELVKVLGDDAAVARITRWQPEPG